jgi:hypothetical protein
MTETFFDTAPVLLIYLVLVLVGLAVFELGFRLGRWWQTRTPDEKYGSTGLLVGAMLTLLAFLLGFSISMATDRYNTRRTLVLTEANAINTAYLRAGYLPAPYRENIRAELRTYVPLRIATDDYDLRQANISRARAIQDTLWTLTEELARDAPESTTLALFIESLNQVIDLQTERAVSGIYVRVPDTVMIMLITAGILTVGMVGYNAGLSRKRSLISAVFLIVLMTAAVSLVIDLDRPQAGMITTSQQALLDLQAKYESDTEP